ncbi:aldo/keto reductase [Sphingosinicella rhizophila]|uniref:Aldo/keto reductase n=1 Tax=Sphingosinicella rhizophila TaxID=3050082 RepID=A0ABU3Q706_9SPHN|nr:aldo/keto reductase [Sphingosinicella sp. GR2756]MDT9599193.1 aldo/keto reductase [Sphingosinicella sp. GR2756]
MIDRRTLLGTLAALPMLGTGACAATSRQPLSSAAATHTRPIPGANEQVPVIGVGTARRFQGASSEEQLAPLRAAITRFVELGGRLIDTAPSYGDAEQVIGRLVEELGVSDRLFLATKVAGANAAEAQTQIEQSFRNLRTRHIDLIALHNQQDAINKLAVLRELKAQGRVRSIGASISSQAGFAPTIDAVSSAPGQAEQYAGFEELMRRERLDVIQVDYAIDNRGASERILPLAQEQGLAVMVNLPFGRGRLLQATQGRPLPDWASEIGAKTWAQVCLKYIVSHPVRPIAIPGMAQARYVEDNMGAARGPLPDAAMRRRMEQYIDAL